MLLLDCSSSGHHRRRGKLSDAVDKASDENEEDRKVDTKPEDRRRDDYYEEQDEYVVEIVEVPIMVPVVVNEDTGDTTLAVLSDAGSESSGPTQAGMSTDTQPESSIWLSLSGGTGLLKQDNFYGLNHFDISIGAYFSQRGRIEILVGGGWAPIQETSYLSQSLKNNVQMLNLGLVLKFYSTPRYTFLGQYFLFGLHYTLLHWEYKNPILADVYDEFGYVIGTEEISVDNLGGIGLYAGIGLNLIQSPGFQLGGELSPGVIFWGVETTQGFDNDVFDPFLYIKFSIILNIRIKD
jgi:hypothetical protein